MGRAWDVMPEDYFRPSLSSLEDTIRALNAHSSTCSTLLNALCLIEPRYAQNSGNLNLKHCLKFINTDPQLDVT